MVESVVNFIPELHCEFTRGETRGRLNVSRPPLVPNCVNKAHEQP